MTVLSIWAESECQVTNLEAASSSSSLIYLELSLPHNPNIHKPVLPQILENALPTLKTKYLASAYVLDFKIGFSE